MSILKPTRIGALLLVEVQH